MIVDWASYQQERLRQHRPSLRLCGSGHIHGNYHTLRNVKNAEPSQQKQATLLSPCLGILAVMAHIKGAKDRNKLDRLGCKCEALISPTVRRLSFFEWVRCY